MQLWSQLWGSGEGSSEKTQALGGDEGPGATPRLPDRWQPQSQAGRSQGRGGHLISQQV